MDKLITAQLEVSEKRTALSALLDAETWTPSRRPSTK